MKSFNQGDTEMQGKPGRRAGRMRAVVRRYSYAVAFVATALLTIPSTNCLAVSSASDVIGSAKGTVLYVSIERGNNKNAGTKDNPLKNLDAALKKAKAGDTIVIAEGVYPGTFGIGYFESNKPVKLYGGFSSDFGSRDILKHPTRLQPDNASGAKARKALMKFTSAVDGLVIDGLVFDMGVRNSYHPTEGKPDGVETGLLLLPPAKAPGDAATVTEPCLSLPSAVKEGDVTISNNIFANCANFGIQAGLRKGTYTVTNNVFVANRMAAIEIYGTCRNTGGPKTLTLCGNAEIANNTVLFTWSRLKDFLDMGYGIRVMTKVDYNIHHNLIGANIMAGVEHARFNNDEWVRIDNNQFFVNKGGDLQYSPASNTNLFLSVDQFGDLPVASATGNKSEIPKVAVDKAYLEGMLSARYSEEADYNPDSPANQLREMLGMNKQGKLKTKVSMFGNRYPATKAAELFGAVSGVGAQIP